MIVSFVGILGGTGWQFRKCNGQCLCMVFVCCVSFVGIRVEQDDTLGNVTVNGVSILGRIG